MSSVFTTRRTYDFFTGNISPRSGMYDLKRSMYSDGNEQPRSIFFTPEQVSVVALAFDRVCDDLRVEPSSARAREIVAQQVIGKARANFPDPDKIREATLRGMGLSAECFMNPPQFSSIFSDR